MPSRQRLLPIRRSGTNNQLARLSFGVPTAVRHAVALSALNKCGSWDAALFSPFIRVLHPRSAQPVPTNNLIGTVKTICDPVGGELLGFAGIL